MRRSKIKIEYYTPPTLIEEDAILASYGLIQAKVMKRQDLEKIYSKGTLREVETQNKAE